MSERKSLIAHVDSLRKLIKQFSDDSIFDQEFLYKIFIDSRAVILHREMDKLQQIHQWNFQTIPIALTKAEYTEDALLPEDTICQVRKSDYRIPSPISTKFRDVIQVTGYDGTPISWGNAFDATLLKNTRTMANKPLVEIQDMYLIIHNALTTKAIKVRGVFADPLEVWQYPRANAAGVYSDQTLLNVEEQLIPLDVELNDIIYGECLKKLGFPFKLPQDQSNNSKSPLNES